MLTVASMISSIVGPVGLAMRASLLTGAFGAFGAFTSGIHLNRFFVIPSESVARALVQDVAGIGMVRPATKNQSCGGLEPKTNTHLFAATIV